MGFHDWWHNEGLLRAGSRIRQGNLRACWICNTSFSSSDALWRHIRRCKTCSNEICRGWDISTPMILRADSNHGPRSIAKSKPA